MTGEILQQFANTRGYKSLDNMMVGSYQGYPFVAKLQTKKLSTLTTVITTGGGKLPNRAGRQLRKQLPKRCGLTWNGYLTLICSGRDEELLTTFTTAMDMLTNALRENGVTVQDKCPICKKGGCDTLALTGTLYTPVHRECCQERSYAAATNAEMNARQGSYFTGVIGAILGALLATLPSLLTIWFVQKIYAALFFLIPLGCYYGYRLFKGKMSKAVGVITILLSLLMPFVLELLVFYLTVATELSIVPSIWATTALYFQLFTVEEMVTSMLMPYVFLIFGFVVTFKQITRTSANDVDDAGVLLESMTSYGAASFSAYDCDHEDDRS